MEIIMNTIFWSITLRNFMSVCNVPQERRLNKMGETLRTFLSLKTFLIIFSLLSLGLTFYNFSILKLILLFSATTLGFLQAYQFYGNVEEKKKK